MKEHTGACETQSTAQCRGVICPVAAAGGPGRGCTKLRSKQNHPGGRHLHRNTSGKAKAKIKWFSTVVKHRRLEQSLRCQQRAGKRARFPTNTTHWMGSPSPESLGWSKSRPALQPAKNSANGECGWVAIRANSAQQALPMTQPRRAGSPGSPGSARG